MNDDLLDAWLAVFARDGWRGAAPEAAAGEAGLDAGAVLTSLGDRWDAVAALSARIDRMALGEASAGNGLSTRERLFDLLMARFDALQAQREGFVALIDAARSDPALGLFLLSRLTRAMRRTAEAAGVDTGGWRGPLRVRALLALYIDVARTWQRDEEPDMARTMRALDAALARAERLAGRRRTVTPPLPEAPPPSGDQPAGSIH